MSRFLSFILIASFVALPLQAEPIDIFRQALEKQGQHQTVWVRFRHVKKLPALNEPLSSQGQVWLIPGRAFRWELGQPKQQTVLYEGRSVYILDEVNKTGVRLDPDDRRAKPLLLTLGIGKDATFEELDKTFKIEATNQVDDHFVARLIPRSGRIKRHLSSLIMQVNLSTSFLEKVGWTQKDGTNVETIFRKPVVDKPLPKDIFTFSVADYTWEK